MFKIVKGRNPHRLSPNFDLVNSSRRSLIMRMRKVNTEFGGQSLFFRSPILCNGLNNETRIQDDVARFKVAVKGTCVNLNKNVDDFFYH